jgi:hypothetical protein
LLDKLRGKATTPAPAPTPAVRRAKPAWVEPEPNVVKDAAVKTAKKAKKAKAPPSVPPAGEGTAPETKVQAPPAAPSAGEPSAVAPAPATPKPNKVKAAAAKAVKPKKAPEVAPPAAPVERQPGDIGPLRPIKEVIADMEAGIKKSNKGLVGKTRAKRAKAAPAPPNPDAKKVGDVLPDGRVVDEVDAAGKPVVLSRPKSTPKPEPETFVPKELKTKAPDAPRVIVDQPPAAKPKRTPLPVKPLDADKDVVVARNAIQSSAFKSYGYDAKNKILEVEHTDGKIYRYNDIDITPEELAAIEKAESKGKALGGMIRTKPSTPRRISMIDSARRHAERNA